MPHEDLRDTARDLVRKLLQESLEDSLNWLRKSCRLKLPFKNMMVDLVVEICDIGDDDTVTVIHFSEIRA